MPDASYEEFVAAQQYAASRLAKLYRKVSATYLGASERTIG